MADPLRPDDFVETPDALAAAWLAAEDPEEAEPDPDLPDDGFPPLDDAFLDQLDRDLDALARGAGPRPQPPAGGPRTGRNRPYAVHQVPILRQQWNPRLRRHPDWPEEWFVRVPGTAVTWSRQDLERVAQATGARPAMQLVSFPTAAAAEQFAQAVWRRRWRRVVAADAVVNPIRQHYFTCDPDHPEDDAVFQALQAESRLPAGVVLHRRRLRMAPAHPAPRPVSAEDPAEPLRQQWDLPRPAGAHAASAEPPWHPWEARPGQWALVRWEGDAPAFWRTASGRPGLFALPPGIAPDAAAEALQRRMPAGVPCAPGPWTPGFDQADRLRQALREALETPMRPAPAVDRWLADGRLLLLAARDLARQVGPGAGGAAYLALAEAATAAVRRIRPDDGVLPATPRGFRADLAAVTEAAAALARAAGAPDPAGSPLVRQALAWRHAGEALTADALGLFATGRTPDPLAGPVAAGVHALADDPGTLALADRAEEFATRLPNGQWIRWAADPPWGDAARAATPDAYQPSLAAVPEPRWVDPHAYPDLDTVRALAADHGATLTVLDHPGAVADWEAAITRKLGPEAAAPVIQAARTPHPDRVPPERPPEPTPAAPPEKPAAWTFYVSPWDHDHLVVWARSRDGRVARPAAEDPKTRALRPLDGRRKADRPLLLAHDGTGLPAVLARAQERWPALQPADLPEAVAKRLVDRHGIRPGAPLQPADALWRVSVLPGTGTAFAWTREITATRETGRDGPYWKVRQTEAVLVDAATRAPWTRKAADDATALREAVAALERQGLAAVPMGREAPKFAVDQVVADPERLRIPERRAPAPPDPFATFAALERPQKDAVLAALPEPLNRRVVQGAYGLTPREIAQASRILVDVAARQLRQAERALADYFAQHPEVRPPRPAPAADAPEAAAPRPAGPRPALGL